MTYLTIQVPDKFKSIVLNDIKLKQITNFFIEDYLTELYQDIETKKELENNLYDIELNNRLKKSLGI